MSADELGFTGEIINEKNNDKQVRSARSNIIFVLCCCSCFQSNGISRMLWIQLASLYGVCGIVSIMAVCIFIQDKLNKVLRTGIYLFAAMNWISFIGYSMFPLLDSGMNGTSIQDRMHMVVTIIVVIFSIASLVLIMIGGYR